MENWDYIAIEGVIGVGKTTLAKLLSREYKTKLVLEDIDGNPFLPQFYENPDRYAFTTQIFFLLSRYNELRNLTNRELFTRRIISDYTFDKDKLFAFINLEKREVSLYEKIYNLLDKDIVKPNLVIYLQASIDTLTERIKARGRSYERRIKEDYIKLLIRSYNEYFFHSQKSTVLIVNSNEFDFLNEPSHLQLLKKEIAVVNTGINYLSITQ